MATKQHKAAPLQKIPTNDGAAAPLKRDAPWWRKDPRVEMRAFTPDTAGDGQTIVGHPSVVGQETIIAAAFREIIDPGAFDDADMDNVILSVNHDLSRIPFARYRRQRPEKSTMTLALDEIGLAMTANLDTARNQEANALYGSIDRGDMDGMSFIFAVGEDHWENLNSKPPEMPIRHIQKIAEVIEVSVVTWPAYEQTDINARDMMVQECAQRVLENARSKAGGLQEQRDAEIEALRLKIHIATLKG